MAYFSVLNPVQPDTEDVSRPGFLWDLNLNQVIDAIQQQFPQHDITKMYYRFPVDEACAAYRREIYQDLKQPELYECFQTFVREMREAAKAAANRDAARAELQREAWHAGAAYGYGAAVSGLQKALSAGRYRSAGLRKLAEYLEEYTKCRDFQECREEAQAIREMLAGLYLRLEIEGNRITVTRGRGSGAYGKRLGCGEEAMMPAPFSGSPDMSPLEEAVFGAFRRKNPELFDRISDFGERYPSYEDPEILRLERELPFYLAFYRLEEKMKERGFAFCVPEKTAGREMEGSGLYDLALAWVNCARGKAVVSNDFVYEPGERFFVVGGPNQGGKTTFARSLGQLVYLAGMGLDVPAVRAKVPYFKALLTHFSAEESLGSGKGKLKEELTRLAPMMREEAEGAFVIINELFTTAAHYDGCVMGRRVLNHFIQKGGMGVYVTHLKELGDAVKGVAPLTALLDGSRERKRTYKIGRERMEGVGYAEDIVKKYGLTYRELQQRLTEDRKGWKQEPGLSAAGKEEREDL